MSKFIKIYRFLFARRFFLFFNKLLFRCGACGLGFLNYENRNVSGENVFLEKYFKTENDGVVVDVGANVGSYSEFLKNMRPDLSIIAFEPHPKNFEVLKKNSIKNRYCAINKACGERNGHISLFDYMVNDGSSHASIYKGVIENIHGADSVEHKVELVKLDDELSKLGVDCISLLKIDAEGNELQVLLGASYYIKRRKIKAIHFEFNEMNVISRSYFRDFFNLLDGFSLYRLLPHGMIPIDKYIPFYCEIFAYSNVVAIRQDD